MTLSFSYDLQKDIENYLITTRSINNKQPTKVQSLYIARYGATFEREKLETFIREYIEDEKIAFEQKIHQIESDWQNIEQPFFDKVAAIVGSPSPIDVLHVYLTTDTRCSYNIEQGYFYVSASTTRSTNLTIMHELLHFWTYWVFEKERKDMTNVCFNDVKESLTELLNIEFQELLNGAHDEGYPQHQAMRAIVRKTWVETGDIRKTFEAAAKLCPGS